MKASKRVALAGVLAALTMVLSYVERLIPLDIGVPGIKPGFANIGVLAALYLLGGGWAAAVSLVRVAMTGLLFTGVSAMLYSLAGAAAALAVMIPMKRCKVFGMVGVSAGGAAAHITGQLALAAVLLGNSVWVYSPWLYVAAAVTGVFNGVAAAFVVARLDRV